MAQPVEPFGVVLNDWNGLNYLNVLRTLACRDETRCVNFAARVCHEGRKTLNPQQPLTVSFEHQQLVGFGDIELLDLLGCVPIT
jgi:hypothetical protein